MGIFDKNHKIGIELELHCRGGVEGVRNWIHQNNIAGLSVCSDGSLHGGNGAEVKFDQGVPINEARERIEAMYRIATEGSTLRTWFARDESTTYTGEVSNMRLSGGETGLHIHFGLPPNWKAVDIFRLVRNINTRIDDVLWKSWRINNHWANVPTNHKDTITQGLERALRASDMEDVSATRFGLLTHKYNGVNLGNLRNSYLNTIEFRFAHASLMTEPDAFESYLETLTEIWDSSFNDQIWCNWGNYKLKEISPMANMNRKCVKVYDATTRQLKGKARLTLGS